MTSISETRWRPAPTRRGALPGLAAHLDPAALPRNPHPMLCTLVAEPFNDDRWMFEPKYDGLRVLGVFDGEKLTLLSRNEQEQNLQFPDIVAALQANLRYPAVVDGEVVCFDAQGRTSFRVLQQRFHLKDAAEVQQRMQEYPAFLYLFDILYVDHYDVTGLPLEKRKELLREAVDWSEHIRWTPFQDGDMGVKQFRHACREQVEGIVGKLRTSRYVGGRSDAWVKIKCLSKQEFVIVGFTDPQRSRVGLGALLVGYYSDDGKQLIYAGKVGTGFTHETLLDLRARLEPLVQRTSPITRSGAPHGENVHWVKPRLVAEIAFSEWTQHSLLRQPRFEGLRPDKKPKECHRERPRRPPRNHDQTNHQTPDSKKGTSAMALEIYRAKRDFRVTPEPGPRPARPHAQPLFVIQEHHASRLHYDFRLEADGVLKSWAVPKEPSLDPADKRLAVHVEDHPLEYASFKGKIPEGQYGAGTVRIWDSGTYENLSTQGAKPVPVSRGIDAGRLEFLLHGKKLKGRFALIRMKKASSRGKDNWLLIKMRDEFAHPENGQASDPPAQSRAKRRSKRGGSPAPSKGGNNGVFNFTHVDKVLFPEGGITKGDVLSFYSRIAPNLLPFLRDRPVTVERLPDGLARPESPRFWQKDTPDYYPTWIPRVELPTERGKPVHYALVNSIQTLLYMVNQGALTFHTWLSRVEDLDRPDCVLFDLDPGQARFADVVTIALALRKTLKGQGERAFVKTSGKAGLHVLVPWTKDGGYDEARAWALDLAHRVAEEHPDKATTEIRKVNRGSRVYVDIMQNVRGHHAVPPYVVRAVPQATVSTPLQWKELTPALDPGRFTVTTIFRRLTRQKKDPLAPLLRTLTAKE